MRAEHTRGLAGYLGCAEAFVLLASAHAAIHCLAFRHTTRLLRRWSAPPEAPGVALAMTKEARGHIALVRWAVQTVSRRHPLRPRCLARAIAARLMLSRRGISSTLYLGLRNRDPRRQSEIVAHAWLGAADLPVVGGRGKAWKVVGRFA